MAGEDRARALEASPRAPPKRQADNDPTGHGQSLTPAGTDVSLTGSTKHRDKFQNSPKAIANYRERKENRARAHLHPDRRARVALQTALKEALREFETYSERKAG